MEGSHVIHTDEDGNILLDEEGDQELHKKQQMIQEFFEVFEAVKNDPAGAGLERCKEFFKDEVIMMERMQNTFGGETKK